MRRVARSKRGARKVDVNILGVQVFLPVDCRLENGTYCGRCCWGTQMPLTAMDIKRIASLGYSPSYFVVKGADGVLRLRNVRGRCVFLDASTGACTIYEYRPLGCRLYPMVYDPEVDGVILDPLCPKRHTVDMKLVRRLKPLLLRLIDEIYGAGGSGRSPPIT